MDSNQSAGEKTVEPKPERREEVMKILQMIENGKIDEEKAFAMIALLEGKDIVGGADGIVRDKDSCKRKGGVRIGGAVPVLGLLFTFGLLFGFFFYLPLHAPLETLTLVYGLLGVFALCGTLIAVSAIGIGRLAVKKRNERSAAGTAEEPKKRVDIEIS